MSIYQNCSGYFQFSFFKIAQNELIRFYNRIKEKTIPYCVNRKTNTLNKKHIVANVSTKVIGNRTIPPGQLPPYNYRGGLQIFYTKRNDLVKKRSCFRTGDVSRIFIISNPFQCYLHSLSEILVCVSVFIYIISISVFCVSQEELSCIESNQQIYDFYE